MTKRRRTEPERPLLDLDESKLVDMSADTRSYVREVVSTIARTAAEATSNLRVHEVRGRVDAEDAAWYLVRIECTCFPVSDRDMRQFHCLPETRQGEVYVNPRRVGEELRYTITTTIRID